MSDPTDRTDASKPAFRPPPTDKPDAGTKILRVVEAAKLVNRIALESGNSESAAFWKAVAEMREALAALGGEKK